MEGNMINFINSPIGQTIIISIVLPLITLIGGALFVFIKKKIEEITGKITDSTVKNYVEDAIDSILQAVASTSQTFVDSLKKSGKFDDEAKKVAFNKSREVALKMITEDTKMIIMELYGDFPTWLDSKIEQLVKKQNG